MTALKKKITAKDFNPKRLLGQPEDVRRILLGRLMGVATGTTKATGNDGETLIGVTGQFKYQDQFSNTPDNIAVPIYSGVLWFPSGFGLDIIHELTKEHPVEALKFAYDVGVQRAENPAGYEWLFGVLVAPVADNPLDQLEASVSKEAPKIEAEVAKPAIADQSGGEQAGTVTTDQGADDRTEAPAETKGKGAKAKEKETA